MTGGRSATGYGILSLATAFTAAFFSIVLALKVNRINEQFGATLQATPMMTLFILCFCFALCVCLIGIAASVIGFLQKGGKPGLPLSGMVANFMAIVVVLGLFMYLALS